MTVSIIRSGGKPRPSRPVLRYFGGKYRIAPWIVSHLPPHRTYVELFAGAASVLMAKPRSWAEVYNDLDAEIVNVFRVLREDVSSTRLCKLLELTPYARDEWREAYYPAVDPVEQARRTIVKATMGIGSSSLFAGKGDGKIWTGFRSAQRYRNQTEASGWATYPTSIAGFVERLRGVVIENRPAVEVIHQHDTPQTLFYADPPYVMASRTREYYTHEMTDAQHRELLAALRGAEGMVVLSGYRSALYDEMLADWVRYERNVRGEGGVKRREVLWLNAAAATRQTQGKLFGNSDTGEGGL